MPYTHRYIIAVRCGKSGCNRGAVEREPLTEEDGGRGKARDRLREAGWTIQFNTLRSAERIRCPEHSP